MMYSADLRTRIIRSLLTFHPEVLARKSAAASSVRVLAEIIGLLSSVILRENGEATFKECLAEITEDIERAARASVSAPTPPIPRTAN